MTIFKKIIKNAKIELIKRDNFWYFWDFQTLWSLLFGSFGVFVDPKIYKELPD